MPLLTNSHTNTHTYNTRIHKLCLCRQIRTPTHTPTIPEYTNCASVDKCAHQHTHLQYQNTQTHTYNTRIHKLCLCRQMCTPTHTPTIPEYTNTHLQYQNTQTVPLSTNAAHQHTHIYNTRIHKHTPTIPEYTNCASVDKRCTLTWDCRRGRTGRTPAHRSTPKCTAHLAAGSTDSTDHPVAGRGSCYSNLGTNHT